MTRKFNMNLYLEEVETDENGVSAWIDLDFAANIASEVTQEEIVEILKGIKSLHGTTLDRTDIQAAIAQMEYEEESA